MNRIIYARNTKALKINEDIAQSFISENHSQGSYKKIINKISIGLFYQKELVGVVQFCSPRTSKKKRDYSSELLRLCFKKDTRIIGGASKLIAFYINKYNPDDFFTYQDTTGENTEVYKKAGMNFVYQNKKKKYLIKNGLTFDTARFGKKEIYTVGEVVRRGPDSLLGTDLGEVSDENGKKLTNIQLFEKLGWHIEETSGDKIYEWINPKKSYYTYKITATDSDKYYYGVHTLNIPKAKENDCLNDRYFGSGGAKFQNWKKKHKEKIKKEIINIYDRKQKAMMAEKDLIKELWSTDILCLNSQRGGISNGFQPQWEKLGSAITIKYCDIHGNVKHQGNSCFKCASQGSVSEKYCDIHGITKFQGNICKKCVNLTSVSEQNCDIHGLTKYRGNFCVKCYTDKSINIKFCTVHGLTKHRNNSCVKCYTDKSISKKVCKIHGLTKYRGNKCCKCQNEGLISIKYCKIHGNVKHHGSICSKCTTNGSVSEKYCAIHGLTKFQGNVCNKCNSQKSVSERECKIHGLTKFQGDKCCKCTSQKSIIMKNCPIHNFTKFIGNSCAKCAAQTRNHKAKKHLKYNSNCPLCVSEKNHTEPLESQIDLNIS